MIALIATVGKGRALLTEDNYSWEDFPEDTKRLNTMLQGGIVIMENHGFFLQGEEPLEKCYNIVVCNEPIKRSEMYKDELVYVEDFKGAVKVAKQKTSISDITILAHSEEFAQEVIDSKLITHIMVTAINYVPENNIGLLPLTDEDFKNYNVSAGPDKTMYSGKNNYKFVTLTPKN